jgi:hypothetical protein
MLTELSHNSLIFDSPEPPRLPQRRPLVGAGDAGGSALYCTDPALDVEVRCLLGEAITAQIADSDAQEISANPLPDLKSCRVLTDYGSGDEIDEGVRISCDNVTRVARYLASDKGKIIDRHRGKLECDLACGGRFTAKLPPGTRAPGFTIAFTVTGASRSSPS